jgi:hypothetical protein
MTFAERCQQEQRLADHFTLQREANDRNDHDTADALFEQIWGVLAAEPQASHSKELP